MVSTSYVVRLVSGVFDTFYCIFKCLEVQLLKPRHGEELTVKPDHSP